MPLDQIKTLKTFQSHHMNTDTKLTPAEDGGGVVRRFPLEVRIRRYRLLRVHSDWFVSAHVLIVHTHSVNLIGVFCPDTCVCVCV